VRFSCDTASEPEARRVLKAKLALAGVGKLPTAASRHTMLDDLRQLVLDDYRDNGYDSGGRQEDAFDHLAAFFGADCPADEITSTRITAYKAWRREQPDGRSRKTPRIGCSTATVNRELAALRHAFRLAARQTPPLVIDVPYIGLAREHNVRTGFFSEAEFIALRGHLPAYLQGAVTASYFTGWRLPSEILTREKRHIADGMLTLESGEGKNDEPRQFPLDIIPELAEVIERQLEATRKLEVETGRVINWLFHNNGRAIVNYDPAWHKAAKAAGLSGRIAHDFRRTAARNLVNAGVDPFTTMKLVGWKSIAMLQRYNIIDPETLKAGVGKLALHLAQRRQPEKPKVSPIRG
jgi:integrase